MKSLTFHPKTYLVILSLSLGSCAMNNRMTSPEILEKEEKIVSVGLLSDFIMEDNEMELYFGDVAVTYRTGLAENHELGFTLYANIYPALSFDWKHKLIREGNFLISGDLAIFGGYYRPIGYQYDLLIGNSSLYAVAGYYHDLAFDFKTMTFGLGSEFGENDGFGMQLMYLPMDAGSLFGEELTYGSIRFGIKYDFKRVKKKYRKH